MQIFRSVLFRFQRTDKEIPQYILFFQHNKGTVEKFRKDNKIHGDVIYACRKDFMDGIGIEQQQFPGMQSKGNGTVDDMGGRTVAHINHFNIIMLMGRKIHKQSVGT